MDEVLKSVQELLKKMSDIIYKTLQQELDQIANLEEKATSMITNALSELESNISEISKQSEAMKKCIEKKQPEFVKIQTRMKNKLVECYKKHYGPLDTLRAERAKIHESASQLKLEAQKMMEKCMKASESVPCFRQSLADLAKKAEKLAKKFEVHVKREAEIRLKSVKLVHQCDERVTAEARQQYSRFIEDLKKCAK